MFNVTRLATTMTKLERKVIKNVARKNINLSSATDDFKSLLGQISKDRDPYSKNIFKRAFSWVKSFCTNYKETNKMLKKHVTTQKQKLAETFNKKATVKDFITYTKNELNEFKEEISSLLKTTKK